MTLEHRYVLMLDGDLDFIRLFRADSPMRPQGDPAWEGDGLRRAYDAMKRLNRERRPIVLYHACTSRAGRGLPACRVFRELPGGDWTLMSTHASLALARAACRVAKEDARKAAVARDEATLKKLRRVGVDRKKVPRLTAKDIRYLEWMESRAELIQDAA